LRPRPLEQRMTCVVQLRPASLLGQTVVDIYQVRHALADYRDGVVWHR
jgi:hypothetical protein